jgi:hypothetical protein
MAKRASQDIKPQNANPRKTKKRLAIKKAMLEARRLKKEENKKTWKKK